MEIREHIPLAPLVTFRAGGSARYYITAHEVADVASASSFAAEKGLPLFVLGGGSNTLPPDGEWMGVVLHMKIKGIITSRALDMLLCDAGAGEAWDDLVLRAIKNGAHGVENLSWIPGSVGAAPVQNIGAYGAEVATFINSVTVFDLSEGKERTLTKNECAFGYRESLFKSGEPGRYVVLRVSFRFPIKSVANVGYGDGTGQFRGLREYFKNRAPEDAITPMDVRAALKEIRGEKFSPLSGEGTAGSFFKNPVVPRALAEELRSRFPKMPLYETDDSAFVKLPAGFLIEHVAGLRGFQRGNVSVSMRHALALANNGNATASEIKDLADFVIRKINETSSVILEPEVVIL